MKIAINVLAVLVGLLSVAAGVAKAALVPEEVAFLNQFGVSNSLVIIYGITQILGGALIIIPATRFYGSLIAAVAFLISAILILLTGNMAFAAVSLVPVLLASFIAYKCDPR